MLETSQGSRVFLLALEDSIGCLRLNPGRLRASQVPSLLNKTEPLGLNIAQCYVHVTDLGLLLSNPNQSLTGVILSNDN